VSEREAEGVSVCVWTVARRQEVKANKYMHKYIYILICIYMLTHTYIYTCISKSSLRDDMTGIERWGAGVEYHFQKN